MKKIGLALGGGGARGLAHIPILEALDEMKVKPVVISGTSIGAILGSFYASGYSGREIRDLTLKIGLRDINKMLDLNFFGDALFKGKGVENFFAKYLKPTTFEELKIPMYIVATDFWNRSEVVMNKGSLVPAIRASMSVPGVFDPVSHDNSILVDGGAVNPLPYDIIREKCDILIAIDVSGRPSEKHKNKPPSMIESILGTFQIMQDSILENKRRISDIDLYVKPDIVDIGILEFHKYKQVFQSGDNEVENFKDRLQDLLKGTVQSFFERLRNSID